MRVYIERFIFPSWCFISS